MRIVFFNHHEKKGNPGLRIKVTLSVVLSCSLLISIYLFNQPGVTWEEAGQWRIRVSQRADHIVAPTTPWLIINELKVDLAREENGSAAWCLRVSDIKGNELFPGVAGLLIHYSDDLKIVDGSALNRRGQKVMNIDEFFYLSLYRQEFFCPQRTKYQNFALLFKDRIKVGLSETRGENVWWDKKHSWWVSYQCESPPLKAELIIE